MMDKVQAKKARDRALQAIERLHSILETSDNWDSDQLSAIKKGVGLAIGRIEMEILSPIYERYPDLDDIPHLR